MFENMLWLIPCVIAEFHLAFHDYLFNHTSAIIQDSTAAASRFYNGSTLWPSRELSKDDLVTLTWEPGRRCVVEYLGQNRFEVKEAVNTHLLPGDTFSCAMMVEAMPLYIDDLRHDGSACRGYVCGRISGIHIRR